MKINRYNMAIKQNNQWISQQILIGDNHYIYCLIVNNNQDLIISGSYDYTIKFWMKKNEWTYYKTIKDHSSYVYGLSTNQQQNRVISCGYDQLILIMEQQGCNKEQIVIQKITVEQSTYRISLLIIICSHYHRNKKNRSKCMR
ncbi:unnamed protein product [Paramecium primaurelia]|uniref:Uncharacterized protein n=1 Tax=Paramecium primaurelia TaxID=5886 RepID=A0A8S1PCX8_PARPR|nr:unnamed protein product [Paramecium primaurelia]